MKKKNIIITIACAILLIGVTAIIGKSLLSDTDKPQEKSDALKFKEEYENLNSDEKYSKIEIESENPIKYISVKEALDILDSKNAIIYVGAEWCPWCRNAVPVLLDTAKAKNIEIIYYLKLDDEKSLWDVVDGKPEKTRDGSSDYYKLLEKLKDELRDYTLKDEKGKELKTGEKRIYMPLVLGIKDGAVVGKHESTVSLNKGQTAKDKLTEKQVKELSESYSKLFDDVFSDKNNTCDIGESCE